MGQLIAASQPLIDANRLIPCTCQLLLLICFGCWSLCGCWPLWKLLEHGANVMLTKRPQVPHNHSILNASSWRTRQVVDVTGVRASRRHLWSPPANLPAASQSVSQSLAQSACRPVCAPMVQGPWAAAAPPAPPPPPPPQLADRHLFRPRVIHIYITLQAPIKSHLCFRRPVISTTYLEHTGAHSNAPMSRVS